jgi:hypothetical protein
MNIDHYEKNVLAPVLNPQVDDGEIAVWLNRQIDEWELTVELGCAEPYAAEVIALLKGKLAELRASIAARIAKDEAVLALTPEAA